MVSNVRSRLAKLEEARPPREVLPEILDTDTPEEASKKYKQLVRMHGQFRKAPVEVSEMTQEEASELYYAAVPYARRPVVAIEPAPTVEPVDDGAGYEEWQAAHPGELYANRDDDDEPSIEERNEQPEPPPPLMAIPTEPISDDEDWLIL